MKLDCMTWILWLLLASGLGACGNSHREENPRVKDISTSQPGVKITEEVPTMLTFVQQFEACRGRFLSGDKYVVKAAMLELDSLWSVMLGKKLELTEFLMGFRGKQGTSLYGPDFKPYPQCNLMMEDEVHALYLIQSLQLGVFWFNRDGEFPHSFRAKYRNESLNFLYDKSKSHDFSEMHYPFSVSDEMQFLDFDKVWEIYEEAIRKGIPIEVHLRKHGLAWYRLSDTFGKWKILRKGIGVGDGGRQIDQNVEGE